MKYPILTLISLSFGLAISWIGYADDLDPPAEYNKIIKSSESVSTIKGDLFGEQVSMYDGRTKFYATDIDVKGNSSLPVALGRRLSVEQRSGSAYLGGFGIWDVDIPYLSGTFAGAPYKWDRDYRGYTDRCSTFFLADAPPSVFVLSDVHKGIQMHIPGKDDQDLIGILNTGNPVPSDGYNYIWGTRDGTRFKCTDTTANGYPGQGFIAITPDGKKYTFDIGIEKNDAPMKISALQAIARVKIYLLARRIEDRFGNWVAYQYQNGKVTSITSNDGRNISIEYSGDLISSATTDLISTNLQRSRMQ